MGLNLTSAPTVEPLSTADAKTHLRVTGTDEDTYIGALVAAARRKVEAFTRRALITQTWEYVLPGFPAEIRLPIAPAQSITSIAYVDTAGATQTLATTEYTAALKTQAASRIRPAWGKTWPATRDQAEAVTVTFVAGFGDAASDVPGDLVHAVRLLIGHWYANREQVVAGTIATPMPMAAEALMEPWILPAGGS